MVLTPDVMAGRYIDAGCERLIVHAEACLHLHRTLGAINSMGARAAVAINPATPASAVAHVLDLVDLVLVMTVNPGFGGQEYLPRWSARSPRCAGCSTTPGLSDTVDVEVDGGIGPATIAGAAAAGANVLVAGSALYRDRRVSVTPSPRSRAAAEAARLSARASSTRSARRTPSLRSGDVPISVDATAPGHALERAGQPPCRRPRPAIRSRRSP